ncbi:MAG: ATP-binding cassette domain-containing protein [Desulfobacteraceae bacterium]|jgi:putative ABC transport system ATP-binding protein|nr:ATP-binding cassette domain-containing protein [Desulfobacteraceae bacterium]
MNGGLACRHLTVVSRQAGGAERKILNDVCLAAPPGEVVLVTGANGAGKTTLLTMLGGLRRPTAGEVMADGQPVSRWAMTHLDRWRRQVGFVFQEPQFFEDLTVSENLLLALVPLGVPRGRWRGRTETALEAVGMGHLAGQTPWRLSSGEAQRVGLARALVRNPRYLLADEPTAHQDDAAITLIAATLAGAAAEGAVVVVTTHDPRLRQSGIAAAHFVLDGGRLQPAP